MATGKGRRRVVGEAESLSAETHEEVSYEVSSGNVYADLGFEDAEEMAAKASLVREVRRTMERRGLTQLQVSKLTGVDQPTLSKLLRGRVSNFSFDRLTEMLLDLGRNMVLLVEEEEQAVKSAPEGVAISKAPKGHMTVTVTSGTKLLSIVAKPRSPERGPERAPEADR